MSSYIQQNSENPLRSGVCVRLLSLEEVERVLKPFSYWLRCTLHGRQPRRQLSVSAIIDAAAQVLVEHEDVARRLVARGSALDSAAIELSMAVRVARDIIILTGWAHPIEQLRAVASRVLVPEDQMYPKLSNDVLPAVRVLPEGVIRNIIRDSRILIALQFYDACASGVAQKRPVEWLARALIRNPKMMRAVVAHGSDLTSDQVSALTDVAVSNACIFEVIPVTRDCYPDGELGAIIADELSAFMPGFEEVR